MKENLITWSIQNWVTVFLMWLLAWAILALLVRVGTGGLSLPNRANTAAGVTQGNPSATDPAMA